MKVNEMMNKVWNDVQSGGVMFQHENGLSEVMSIRPMFGKNLSCTLANGKLVTLSEDSIWHLFDRFVFVDENFEKTA